ncbi:MAG: TonB-dependent receptor [Bacteroidetes bacterium]|nr:TonB-dependent receptor [Bacteroidota bacterium]MBT4340292.1 TonB-dependent receptor [Bacteroidota bacterium]
MKSKIYSVASFLVIICILIPKLSLAQQSVDIKGVVISSESQKAIGGANVILSPSYFGSATNSKGEFKISHVNPGTYKITASYLGYKHFEKTITVVSGKDLVVNFSLDKGPIILSPTEIEIKGAATMPHAKMKLTQSMIEEEATRDIGDYLRLFPGISGIRKGGSNIDPVVRGFKFDQLNIHMDGGIRIEGGCPNRMDPTSAHVEMEDIDNIEIIKGPYVLRYGPTFGGIVNLVTKKPSPSLTGDFEIHARAVKGFETNWRGDKEHLQIFGGTDKVYFSLAGAQLRYGDYIDGKGDAVSSGFHKWNYNGKIAVRPWKNHEIMFSYIESHGRDVKFAALPMDERSDNTQVMALDYTAKKISDNIEDIKIKLYRSYVDHIMDNKEKSFGDTVAAVSAIDPTVIGGRAEIGLNLGEGHMYIGTDFETVEKFGTRTKNFYAMPPTPAGSFLIYVEPLWANANLINNGVFVEYSNKWDSWEFISSMRFDYNQASSDTIRIFSPNGKILKLENGETNSEYANFSASVGINKHLNENLSVGLGIGRGVRSPNMLERYIILLPVGFDTYDYIGNPSLKPEANHQADLNIKYENDDIGGFYVNGFYSYVIDYISAHEITTYNGNPILANTNGVLGVKEFYNVEDPVSFTGFEFSYATPSKFKLGGQVIASYTQGTFGSNYLKLDKILNDPLNEIPPFEANVLVKYKMFNNKLIPKAGLRIVAAQNRVSESFIESATPAFTLLDFGLVYKYSKFLTITGGIDNILDTEYFEHLNRRALGSSQSIYEPGRVLFVNMIVNL